MQSSTKNDIAVSRSYRLKAAINWRRSRTGSRSCSVDMGCQQVRLTRRGRRRRGRRYYHPPMAGERTQKTPRRVSAGILLFRVREGRLEVLLGHPGGPFFAKKDEGSWTVLKGEAYPGEELPAVARREFAEETGHEPPDDTMLELGEVRQRGGKTVVAWALAGDLVPAEARSNTCEMEWPPRTGRTGEFPEIDRVEWFDLQTARKRILPAQAPFLEPLERTVVAISGG